MSTRYDTFELSHTATTQERPHTGTTSASGPMHLPSRQPPLLARNCTACPPLHGLSAPQLHCAFTVAPIVADAARFDSGCSGT